jgi:hypothetical protein
MRQKILRSSGVRSSIFMQGEKSKQQRYEPGTRPKNNREKHPHIIICMNICCDVRLLVVDIDVVPSSSFSFPHTDRFWRKKKHFPQQHMYIYTMWTTHYFLIQYPFWCTPCIERVGNTFRYFVYHNSQSTNDLLFSKLGSSSVNNEHDIDTMVNTTICYGCQTRSKDSLAEIIIWQWQPPWFF